MNLSSALSCLTLADLADDINYYYTISRPVVQVDGRAWPQRLLFAFYYTFRYTIGHLLDDKDVLQGSGKTDMLIRLMHWL